MGGTIAVLWSQGQAADQRYQTAQTEREQLHTQLCETLHLLGNASKESLEGC